MTSIKRDRAIILAGKVRDGLDADRFDRMSIGMIDDLISDLRTLHLLMGRCSDVELAIHYLERMKRPRADKQVEGDRALNAAVGALSMAYNMAE